MEAQQLYECILTYKRKIKAFLMPHSLKISIVHVKSYHYVKVNYNKHYSYLHISNESTI